MKYGLYCIYNTDTKEYSAPIVFKTEKMAINSFVRHIETSYQKDKRFFSPSDYGLFYVGMFSDASGKVESAKDLKCVINGKSVDLTFVDAANKDKKDKDKAESDADWVVEDDTWTDNEDEE